MSDGRLNIFQGVITDQPPLRPCHRLNYTHEIITYINSDPSSANCGFLSLFKISIDSTAFVCKRQLHSEEMINLISKYIKGNVDNYKLWLVMKATSTRMADGLKPKHFFTLKKKKTEKKASTVE